MGTLAKVAALACRRFVVGRAMLAAALGFVVFVSLADLAGLKSDGSVTSEPIRHLTSELGVGLAVAVAANLVCAVALFWRVVRGRH